MPKKSLAQKARARVVWNSQYPTRLLPVIHALKRIEFEFYSSKVPVYIYSDGSMATFLYLTVYWTAPSKHGELQTAANLIRKATRPVKATAKATEAGERGARVETTEQERL
jgi:hypothetical protein